MVDGSGEPQRPISITNGPLSYEAPITERGGRRAFFIGLNPQSELLRYDRSARIFVPYGEGLTMARRVEFSRDGQWTAWIRQDDDSLWVSRKDGIGAGAGGGTADAGVHDALVAG